jgi:hypothetical protein
LVRVRVGGRIKAGARVGAVVGGAVGDVVSAESLMTAGVGNGIMVRGLSALPTAASAPVV